VIRSSALDGATSKNDTKEKPLARTVRFRVLSGYLLQPLRLNYIFPEEICDFSTNIQVVTKDIFVVNGTLLQCIFSNFLSERYTAA
jgi:hypothetical protein